MAAHNVTPTYAQPSVLRLGDQKSSSTMAISSAMEEVREKLLAEPAHTSSLLTITAVHYDTSGSPLMPMSEFTLQPAVTLERFVHRLQSMLDEKRVAGLLVKNFEFRVGGPKLPAVEGDLVTTDESISAMIWGGEASQHFKLHRDMLVKGINIMTKPILKVKTVRCLSNVGHKFTKNFKMQEHFEERRAIRSAAQLAEILELRRPLDLNWDSPEFKLAARFMDKFKSDPNAQPINIFNQVYDNHIECGEQPIKLLVFGDIESCGKRSAFWLGLDGIPHAATSKLTKTKQFVPAASMDVPQHRPEVETPQYFVDEDCLRKLVGQMGQDNTRYQAGAFEDDDDETYFPASRIARENAHPFPSLKAPYQRAQHRRSPATSTASGLKLVTQFPKLASIASELSPAQSHASLANPPTLPSAFSPSLHGASQTAIQDGKTILPCSASTSKQTTPISTQLRPESPAFTFGGNKPAQKSTTVSELLQLIQKQDVVATAVKSPRASFDDKVSAVSKALESLRSVASSSPTYYAHGQCLGGGASVDRSHTPSYYSQPRSQGLNASVAPPALSCVQSQTVLTPQTPNTAISGSLSKDAASRSIHPARTASYLSPSFAATHASYYHNHQAGALTLLARPHTQDKPQIANAFSSYQSQMEGQRSAATEKNTTAEEIGVFQFTFSAGKIQ